jgi:hypothetical protein
LENIKWDNIVEPREETGFIKNVIIKPKNSAEIKFSVNNNGIILGGKSDWMGKKLDEAIGK